MKLNWFNLLIGLIIIVSMGITLIITFAPREDKFKRGFISCTNELADKVTACKGSFWCAAKAVLANTKCDGKVIIDGVKLWIDGKQPAPWSNYYFKPDLSHLQDLINENAELFYQENQDSLKDFEALKKDYESLEEKIKHEKEKQ